MVTIEIQGSHGARIQGEFDSMRAAQEVARGFDKVSFVRRWNVTHHDGRTWGGRHPLNAGADLESFFEMAVEVETAGLTA